MIPARSGSKRISEKNIRKVFGKPLIAHTIEQAKTATELDRCIISTDSDKIADVAREYGGEVPFKRPKKLATDTASTSAVVEHALDWVESNGISPDVIVLLQVTSPLRETKDIDSAIKRLQKHDHAESIVSVTEFQVPPRWAVETNCEDVLRPYFDESTLWTNEYSRSQDHQTLYYPNGAIFAARVNAFREQQSFYTDLTLKYEMPPERSIDIDEPFDLEIAHALFKHRDEG